MTSFYEAIRDDPGIGPTHNSLYMAIFQLYNLNDLKNPVNICRKKVMEVAKISGLATFHKNIKDLNTFGYIKYLPSYNSSKSSQANLLKPLADITCEKNTGNR